MLSLLLIQLRLSQTGKRLLVSDIGMARIATVHQTTDTVFGITYALGRSLYLLRYGDAWVGHMTGITPCA